MIGHQLAGRYEIIAPIGGGGMALVYKAQDILLNRNVAIKVLRQQFVYDEEFIRRFRREAQSAASLSHMNVVSIYDVGQESDIHYIVMEYIEGNNLNEIIAQRAPLPVQEAVRITTRIADALDHAHQHDIIHRDIKPHNILIGRNGTVKVTDFGIARAVTSATITQTGSVIGSVHYFSPEHAKGIITGEKSDLYSLGIVLYQMVTGELPFFGESPISIALKHLQEGFQEPRTLNPLIPQTVENIILKTMRKNPQERYQSAQEMLEDLDTCLSAERFHEPKAVFWEQEDKQQTKRLGPFPDSTMKEVSLLDEREESNREDDYNMKTKINSKKKGIMLVSFTVVLLGMMYGVVHYVNSLFHVPNVTVPNVTAMTIERARVALEERGLHVELPVVEQYKEGVAPGIVYKQDKSEGSEVKKGTAVQLTMSVEKPVVTMIDLLLPKQTYDQAVEKLVALGITKDRIQRKDDFSELPSETVVSQTPRAGQQVQLEDIQILLTVSKGEIKMPQLVGLTELEAHQKLQKMGLDFEKPKEEWSYEFEEGIVTRQWPHEPGAAVKQGAKITLFKSKGYPPEAIHLNYHVDVCPAQEGQNSNIKVIYSDARGDNRLWEGPQYINKEHTLTVPLVLSPIKESSVSIYRDGQCVGKFAVTYEDAKNNNIHTPKIATSTPSETNKEMGDQPDEEHN